MMKRWPILVALLLCAIPASAAVSRDGACGVIGTSCTLSGTATNSLKIVVAFSSTSTLPTLLSGWTNVATCVGGQSSGCGGTTGTVRSLRIACNLASSSGDTGTGTWAGTTAIMGWSYSGTGIGTAGNCNTTGIGAVATDAAQSSATVNWDALTLNVGTGTSWVLGAALGSGGIPAVSGGMTSINSASGAPGGIRQADTNAGVSSWTLHTSSVTSGTWVSVTAEILAAGTGVKRLRGKVMTSP
jgi:hypothetical protein